MNVHECHYPHPDLPETLHRERVNERARAIASVFLVDWNSHDFVLCKDRDREIVELPLEIRFVFGSYKFSTCGINTFKKLDSFLIEKTKLFQTFNCFLKY